MFKKYYLYIIFLLFTSAFTSNVRAQQTPIYSQYMFNNFLINPACAGAEGYTAVNLTARDQWVGLPGSPSTYAISANMRILKNGNGANNTRNKFKRKSGRVGLGGYIFSDKVGLVTTTGVQFTYAYHISLNKSQLSFGLASSIYQYKIDKSEITLSGSQYDNLVDNSSLTMLIPDFQVGMAYMYKGAYVGLSVQDLLQSSLRFSTSFLTDLGGNYQPSVPLQLYRTYNAIGYYLFEITNVYAIEPAFWFKIDQTGAKQIDLSARLYYLEDYWGGLSYRTGALGGSIIFMGGIRYQRYFFGYAFDYTMSAIMKSTYGSHEFMIAAKFGANARRFRWVSRY